MVKQTYKLKPLEHKAAIAILRDHRMRKIMLYTGLSAMLAFLACTFIAVTILEGEEQNFTLLHVLVLFIGITTIGALLGYLSTSRIKRDIDTARVEAELITASTVVLQDIVYSSSISNKLMMIKHLHSYMINSSDDYRYEIPHDTDPKQKNFKLYRGANSGIFLWCK